MFSQQQVLDEVRRIRAGEVEPHNSRVYDAWMDRAGDWFVQDDGEYLRNGFVGFNQRSPEIILLDFHLVRVSQFSRVTVAGFSVSS